MTRPIDKYIPREPTDKFVSKCSTIFPTMVEMLMLYLNKKYGNYCMSNTQIRVKN